MHASRGAWMVVVLLAPALAGCLEASPGSGSGTPGTHDDPSGTLLVVALDRYWVNGTDDSGSGTPGMGPGPWCAHADYTRDPPSLHLNQRENETVPDAVLIRNFGTHDPGWNHGDHVRHDFSTNLTAISGAANENRNLWHIRVASNATDTALVSLANGTSTWSQAALPPGETKELRLEYAAEGGGNATEIVVLTNLGRVEPTVGVQPCD